MKKSPYEPQIFTRNGKLLSVVTPRDGYQLLLKNQAEPDEADAWFPNEVVKANVRGDSLIKAWREYFGLTQADLSAKAGIKQPPLARLEKSGSRPRKSTLVKLADAMGIGVEQLVD